jgi:hypothetical protein
VGRDYFDFCVTGSQNINLYLAKGRQETRDEPCLTTPDGEVIMAQRHQTHTHFKAPPARHVAHPAKHVSAPIIIPGGVTQSLPTLMHMGCTGQVITFRSQGNEIVCQLSPGHGIQQMANFNPAIGDVVGVDDILERTLALDNLSNVGNWITSAQSSAGTTLYFDPTGSGQQGVPFACLQGVFTTVAQLVADGGMQYVPDAIEVVPSFTPTFSLRSGGLETVDVLPIKTGIAAQTLIGFNPDAADVLELHSVLNATLANPNLSDITNYVTAKTVNGNTVLSVDPTGSGGAGTAFAVLQGISVTMSQLLADGALSYTPTQTNIFGMPGSTLTFRSAGMEQAVLEGKPGGAPVTLNNFSLSGGDGIDVGQLLVNSGLTATSSTVGDYFSTTQSGGSTTLWFNAQGTAENGAAGSGVAVAVLKNALTSLTDLTNAAALNITGQGATTLDGKLMRMGCPSVNVTYRSSGNEIVCLQAAIHGEQVLVGFNAAAGDVIGVDDILEQTPAQANLSDVAKYITSSVSGGNTTLYFDPTGSGAQGTPFALLEGVTTNVAALVADGGMQYVPDAITATPAFDTTYSFRAAGLTTLDLQPQEPGAAPQQIAGFNPNASDILQLTNILDPTTASPDLSNVANYITATASGGNTVLSVDNTGEGQAGTPFAVLQGETVTVAQLMAANALVYTPTPSHAQALPNAVFTFRPEGQEAAVIGFGTAHMAPPVLDGFSLAQGDQLNMIDLLTANNVAGNLATIGNYLSTQQVGSDTQLWLNASGGGSGGHEIAVLHDTSVTMSQLLSSHALILTA